MFRPKMFRLSLIFTLFAAPLSAEPVSLGALSDYINGLTSAKASFTQFNGDGSRSRGTLYIKRPGRMKFEYAPPNEALVLASAGVVAIFDAKSNAEPQQFPLKRTPLNLLLGADVDLSNTAMVSDHYEDENGLTVVTALDPKNPDTGTLDLYFSPEPLALTQWVLTDESGQKTGVALGRLDLEDSQPNWFFSVSREISSRAN